MKLSDPPAALLVDIPDGAAGTRLTLREMARIVKQYRFQPYYATEAEHIVRNYGASPGQYRVEIEALHAWVRDNIRYLQDPVDVQALRSPDVTLSMMAGNCAQKSILLATLLEAIGHKTRFVAVGWTRPQDFEHVYAETKVGANWMPLETTLMVPAGWAAVPPNIPEPVTSYMVEYV